MLCCTEILLLSFEVTAQPWALRNVLDDDKLGQPHHLFARVHPANEVPPLAVEYVPRAEATQAKNLETIIEGLEARRLAVNDHF